MKISPLIQGGTPGVNLSDTSVTTIPDPQAERAKQDIRRIKMRTNVSPDRFLGEPAEASVDQTGVISDEAVPADAVTEETKPLSPQFAALAKQRRALQVKEREIADREKALESQPQSDGGQELIARLKSSPLSVLQEHGVTYDQLTQAILASPDSLNPEIHQLREEIKALKEGVDKNLSDRDLSAKQQVLAEMQRVAVTLSAEGDAYELVREEKKIPDVMSLIERTYDETGEVLDVAAAMQLVEDELMSDSLRRANFKKVQSKLTPTPTPAAPQQRQNQIRTLTNRDSSSVGLSRRERALMAMNGTLTKG